MNSQEASVLRLFTCLPPEAISPDLLAAVLGPDFPLAETLEKLTEKAFIRKDGGNGAYFLCPESAPELAANPLSQEVSALITLVSNEILASEKTGDSAALWNWLELGVSVWKKFGETFDTEDFRQILERGGRSVAAMNPARPQDFPPSLLHDEKFTPEAAASVMNSCILFSDVVIAGKSTAVGLKYNEENMFAPMIVFLEKEGAADALVWAAEKLGVPVVKNNVLAVKLASYGKAGESIPDVSYGDVSLVFSRLGTARPRQSSRGNAPGNSRESRNKRQGIEVSVPRPLAIELGESLFSLTGEEPGREKLLGEPLNAIKKKITRLLGFTLAPFRVVCGKRLKSDEYRILFRGIEAGRGRLDLGWYPGSVEKGVQGAQSAQGVREWAVIPDLMSNPENIRAAAKAASLVIIRHVNKIISRRAPELLGREEVEAILDAAEEKYPVVTCEVKSLLSLGIIREILQSLVSEQVSIRHIAIILETLADWGSFGPAPSEVVIEQIRQSLKRQICLDYADDEMTLHVMTLEPNLENKFADLFPHFEIFPEKPLPPGSDQKFTEKSPEFTDKFTELWMPEQKPPDQRAMGLRTPDRKAPGERQADQDSPDWAELISCAVHGMEEKGYPPVILCSPKARFPLKEATRSKLPDLAVLSYLEIPSDISVEALGEIRLEGNIRLPG